ncbi:esterase/lipase family protein [Kitasatospora sp. NPDC004240]
MPDFHRDDRKPIGHGVTLRSSAVNGRTGTVRRWATAVGPSRDTEPAELPEQLSRDGLPRPTAQLLGATTQEAGLRPILTVPLAGLTVPPTSGGRVRSTDRPPFVELEVPAPGPDEGQVLLEVDGTGVVRWVLPEPTADRVRAERTAGRQLFRIPVDQHTVPPADGETDRTRGLAGFGFSKVVHLLRYPIEQTAGRSATYVMGRWEERHRPYDLRLTTPETFPSPANAQPMNAERLADLPDGPFLVFVHGTFSRCDAAFRALADDPALLTDLHRRYQGRVLTFDHPTVHLDPAANARWLLDRLPSGKPLTLDLVTHSRGGLVARQLAQPHPTAASRPAPNLRKLIHVATPNAGTVLASQKRLSNLLDVVTNLFALLPDTMGGAPLQVVLEVVKHCATGALGGLDGLTAMDPAAPDLTHLNAAGPPAADTVYAVSSDFKPGPDAGLPLRTLDLLVDRLFGTGNDLVVPTDGVARSGSYVVPNPMILPATDAVAHCDFFRDARVRHRLADWLS